MALNLQYKNEQAKTNSTGFSKNSGKELAKLIGVWTPTQFGEVLNLAEGFQHPVVWNPVEGSDSIEINSASLRLGAAAIENSENFSISKKDSHIDVSVGPGKSLRSLKLIGLKHNSVNLQNSSQISSEEKKLLVCVQDPKGDYTPLYSIPHVPAKGVFPKSFAGASYASDTLSFATPLQAEKVRLQLVDKDFPEQTSPQNLEVSSVSGNYMSLPIDIKASLSDGTELFSFPGVMPLQAADVSVSTIQQFSNLLQTRLDAGEALEATIELEAKPSSAGMAMIQTLIKEPAGYLIRNFSGVHSTVLTGESQTLMLSSKNALASEKPASVNADLSIRYDGIRLLSSLSSRLPDNQGNAQGIIIGSQIGTQSAIRVLPPDAVTNQPLARIGILGRAPQAAELALEVLDYSGAIAGDVVARPSVLKLELSQHLGIHWFEFSEAAPFNHPLAIRLSCNLGRFFWLEDSEQQLGLRIAIYDLDAADEAVKLNDQVFVTGGSLPFESKHHAFPTQHFQDEFPLLDSNLFLRVDIADLQLRYAR